MRNKIVEKSQTYHIFIHLLFGLLCAVTISKYFADKNISILIIFSLFGSMVPDIDHVVYYFTYGKDSEYSRIIKMFVKERDFKDIKQFLRDNHKYLTGLYSHTLISPAVSIFLTYLFFQKQSIYFATLFFSISVHFIYDILEDLLFFGKLNPNWFLRFNKKNKNNDGILVTYLELLKKKIN